MVLKTCSLVRCPINYKVPGCRVTVYELLWTSKKKDDDYDRC